MLLRRLGVVKSGDLTKCCARFGCLWQLNRAQPGGSWGSWFSIACGDENYCCIKKSGLWPDFFMRGATQLLFYTLHIRAGAGVDADHVAF